MLRTLFTIEGRLGRRSYAVLSFLSLAMLALGAVLLVVPFLTARADAGQAVSTGLGAIGGIALVALGLWSAVACSIRRLHDMGYSALWLLLCLVPIEAVAIAAALCLTLLMSFMPGRDGEHALS